MSDPRIRVTHSRPIGAIATALKSARITEFHWVALHILVRVARFDRPQRIAAHPSLHPRRVVPCTVVIEPALLISFLSPKPIALPRKAPETRLSIGRKFLAIDQRTT